MYNIHSIQGSTPTQLQRSREAADRYAIFIALRERRRSRRSAARGFEPTATPEHSGRRSVQPADPAHQPTSVNQRPAMNVVRLQDWRSAHRRERVSR